MRALVISLKTSPERREFQQYQLNKLNINFEFLDAETADNAPELRSEKYWNTGVRLLRNTEKACFLSHWNCWNQVKQTNEPMLILEDDAVLSAKTPLLLADVKDFIGTDVINLETRGRRILLKKTPEKLSELYRLFLNRDGAAAYILWPSGAQKMIAKASKEVGIADALIWTNFKLKAYQTNPALALQSDQCENYGISTPFETKSSIDTNEVLPGKEPKTLSEYLRFRFRRFLEQIRLARPHIISLLTAEKKHLQIERADFNYLTKDKT